MANTEVVLGYEGWEYFLQQVEVRGGPFAAALLERPDPRAGRLVAHVPEDVAGDVLSRRASEFSRGLHSTGGSARDASAEWMASRLRRPEGSAFLLALDYVTGQSPLRLRECGLPFWTRGNRIWWFALGEVATDPAQVARVVRVACMGVGAVGFAGFVPTGSTLPEAFEELDDASVRILAGGIRFAMAVAFDEEGYVCWEDMPGPS